MSSPPRGTRFKAAGPERRRRLDRVLIQEAPDTKEDESVTMNDVELIRREESVAHLGGGDAAASKLVLVLEELLDADALLVHAIFDLDETGARARERGTRCRQEGESRDAGFSRIFRARWASRTQRCFAGGPRGQPRSGKNGRWATRAIRRAARSRRWYSRRSTAFE